MVGNDSLFPLWSEFRKALAFVLFKLVPGLLELCCEMWCGRFAKVILSCDLDMLLDLG